MMWNLSVTDLGSFRAANAASKPCTRCSNRAASPGYPAAVTIATSTPSCSSRMISAIISLSCCMCAPSAYSVPSASKVTSLSPAAASSAVSWSSSSSRLLRSPPFEVEATGVRKALPLPLLLPVPP